MRWVLWGAIILALVALLLWPRPIFKPDWETALKDALEAGDCDRVNTIFRVAQFSHYFADHWRAYLEHERKCGYEPYEGQNLEWLKDQAEWVKKKPSLDFNSILEGVYYFSIASDWSRAIQFAFWDRDITPPSLAFEKFVYSLQCKYQSYRSYPTYQYLRLALREPDLSANDIYDIAAAYGQFCAKRAVAMADTYKRLSPTAFERRSVFWLWAAAGRYLGYGPEIRYELQRVGRELRAYLIEKYGSLEEYELAQDRTSSDFWLHELLIVTDGPGCLVEVQDLPMTLVWCAEDQLNRPEIYGLPNQQGIEHESAYYDLLRSERAGNTLAIMKMQLEAELRPECIAAITSAEKHDAEVFASERGGTLHGPYAHPECAVGSANVQDEN